MRSLWPSAHSFWPERTVVQDPDYHKLIIITTIVTTKEKRMCACRNGVE